MKNRKNKKINKIIQELNRRKKKIKIANNKKKKRKEKKRKERKRKKNAQETKRNLSEWTTTNIIFQKYIIYRLFHNVLFSIT